MAGRNSKVHFSITLSRENFMWIKEEAANQQMSRSQVVDSVIKNYRRDTYMLEKIREVIREELDR